MLTTIEKNLLLACIESAWQEVLRQAGVKTLREVETAVAELRAAYQRDPARVSAEALLYWYGRLADVVAPNVADIGRLFRTAQTMPGVFGGGITANGTEMFA